MNNSDATIRLLAQQGQQIVGLRELIEEKFHNTNMTIEGISGVMATAVNLVDVREHVGNMENDITLLKKDYGSRLEKLERIAWLEAGLFVLFTPVVLAMVIQWLGNLIS
jgi:hypothetical protein